MKKITKTTAPTTTLEPHAHLMGPISDWRRSVIPTVAQNPMLRSRTHTMDSHCPTATEVWSQIPALVVSQRPKTTNMRSTKCANRFTKTQPIDVKKIWSPTAHIMDPLPVGVSISKTRYHQHRSRKQPTVG